MFNIYDEVVYIGKSTDYLSYRHRYQVVGVQMGKGMVNIQYNWIPYTQCVLASDYDAGAREYVPRPYPGIDGVHDRLHEDIFKRYPGRQRTSGTVNFTVVIGKDGVATAEQMYIGASCFGGLNQWSMNNLDTKDGKVVMGVAVNISKYMATMDKTEQANYITFLTYLFTESPWKDAYIPKPVEEVIKNGVMMDVTAEYDFMVGAAIMLRSGWEHKHITPTFKRLIDLGVHPRIAHIVARFTPNNTLTSWSGHELLNNTSMSFADYRSFFKDNVKKSSGVRGSFQEMSFKRAYMLDDVIHGRGASGNLGGLRSGDDGMVQITLHHCLNHHPECVRSEKGWGEGVNNFVTIDDDDQAKVIAAYFTDIILGDGKIPLKAEPLKADAKAQAKGCLADGVWIPNIDGERPNIPARMRVFVKLRGGLQPRGAQASSLWRWSLEGGGADITHWKYETDANGWIEATGRRPVGVPVDTNVRVRLGGGDELLTPHTIRDWVWGNRIPADERITEWRYT